MEEAGALSAGEHAAIDAEAVQTDDGTLCHGLVRKHGKAITLALSLLSITHQLERLQLAKRLQQLPTLAFIKVIRKTSQKDL